MKKFVGIVSLAFIAGMAVPTVEASFAKFTKAKCSQDALLALQSLSVSPQPNCIKGARDSLNNVGNGRAPQSFIHVINVAKEEDPEITVTYDRLLELAQENIKKKIPFAQWHETNLESPEDEFRYETLKEKVAEALNPQAVKLKHEKGIESKQLFTNDSKISAKDCANDLSLAIESALSSNPNKAGMEAAWFETGAKGSKPSFQYIFALLAPEDQASLKNLFAVRAGKIHISGADLKALLMKAHEIAHQYRDALSLYNLKGTYNRFTCTQNFYTALKSVLYPGNNKNCWMSIEQALNSTSALRESLSSLPHEQEQAFRKVLAARKGAIPAKVEDIRILLDLWVKVKDSKTMPTAAVPFKTSGFMASKAQYFSLNKAACTKTLEKFFFALLLEKTHKNCLLGGLDSVHNLSASYKERAPFYTGYKSSKDRVKDGKKEVYMFPGWNDLTTEKQDLFVKLANIRLGQIKISPQEKLKLVLGVMQAYEKAKNKAFNRYTEMLSKPEQAAAMQDEKHDLGNTLLGAAAAMGEQSARVAKGDSAAHASFLADLEIILDTLRRLQARADAEHKHTFDGPIGQLQEYADKLKSESATPTTLEQVDEIQGAAVSAAVVGMLVASADDDQDAGGASVSDDDVEAEFNSPAITERMRIESLPSAADFAHQQPALTGHQQQLAITAPQQQLAITAPQQQLAIAGRVHGTSGNQDHDAGQQLPVDSRGRPIVWGGDSPSLPIKVHPSALQNMQSAGVRPTFGQHLAITAGPSTTKPLAIMPPPSTAGGSPTAASLLAGDGTTATTSGGAPSLQSLLSDEPTSPAFKKSLGKLD